MFVSKEEFIDKFSKYVTRVLSRNLPKDGYEGELWDDAIKLLTNEKEHIDAAYKWPGC